MLPKGYVLMVRDYVAEIVEFKTLEVMDVPDGSHKYHVETKYGEQDFDESELSPIRGKLEKECRELNEAFRGMSRGLKIEGSLSKQ